MNDSRSMPTRTHWLENRIPPPLVWMAAAAAMWTVARRLSPSPAATAGRTAVALFLGVIALGIIGLGIHAFRRARTTMSPLNIQGAVTVVSSGVFGFTRNPMYVGLTALLVAWAVHLASPWALFGPAVFALFIDRFQIQPEERALRSKFGTAYEEYRARVRRWI